MKKLLTFFAALMIVFQMLPVTVIANELSPPETHAVVQSNSEEVADQQTENPNIPEADTNTTTAPDIETNEESETDSTQSANAPPETTEPSESEENEQSEVESVERAAARAALPEIDLDGDSSSEEYNSTFAMQNVRYFPNFDESDGKQSDSGNIVEARTLINAGKFSHSPESTAFGALHEIKEVAFSIGISGSIKPSSATSVKVYMISDINNLDMDSQDPLYITDLASIATEIPLDGTDATGVKITEDNGTYTIDTSQLADQKVSFVIVESDELDGPVTNDTYAKCVNDLSITAIANNAGQDWDGEEAKFHLTSIDELKSLQSDSNHQMEDGLEDVKGNTIITGVKINGDENGQITPGQTNQKLELKWSLDNLIPVSGDELITLAPVNGGSYYTLKLNNTGVSYPYVDIPREVMGTVNGRTEVIGYYTLSRDGYLTMVFSDNLLDTSEQTGTITIELDGLDNYGTSDTIIKVPLNDETKTEVDIPGVQKEMTLSKAGSLPSTTVNSEGEVIFQDITWTINASTENNQVTGLKISDTLPTPSNSNPATHKLTKAQLAKLEIRDEAGNLLDEDEYNILVTPVYWDTNNPDDTDLKGWTATITSVDDEEFSGKFTATFKTTATADAGQKFTGSPGSIKYTNKSTLKDLTKDSTLKELSTDATVTVNKDNWFKKAGNATVDASGNVSGTYTITLNQQRLTISAGVIISDIPQAGWIDTAGKFIGNTITPAMADLVIKENGVALNVGTDYTFSYTDGKLTITLNKAITKAVTISYTLTVKKTEIPNRPKGATSFQIANSATMSGTTAGKTNNFPNIVKKTGTIDYNARTVPFTITVKNDIYQIEPGSYVIEQLPKGFAPASFESFEGNLAQADYEEKLLAALKADISVAGLGSNDYELILVDSDNESDVSTREQADPQRVMIKFKVKTDKDIVITFDTQYFFDPNIFGTVAGTALFEGNNKVEQTAGNDFTNMAYLHGENGDDWGKATSDGNIPDSIWNAQQKSGSGNFQDKKIDWTIDFNAKGESLKTLTIKDPLVAGSTDAAGNNKVPASKQSVDTENLWNNVAFYKLAYDTNGKIQVMEELTAAFQNNGKLALDNGTLTYSLNSGAKLAIDHPVRMIITTDLTGDIQPYYTNKVNVDYTYGNDGETNTDLEATVSFDWAKNPNRKSGNGYTASSEDSAHVDYSVVLNGNRLTYENTTITDTLDVTGGVQITQLVADSLSIHYAKALQENGQWVIDPDRQMTLNVDYFLNYDPSPDNLEGFTISFKEGLKITEPLILSYRANVVGYGDTTKVKNTIKIEGTTITRRLVTVIQESKMVVLGSAARRKTLV
ncbi:collagen binding domain-containing protein [Enterococcus hermanniensis]|nr:hypothetical protein [Enterococcus hermanniensis]